MIRSVLSVTISHTIKRSASLLLKAGLCLLLAGFLLTACKGDEEESKEVCKDASGYVYQTVTIGDQEWMAENLRTTSYSNGTAITSTTSASSWTALSTGACCNYNSSLDSVEIYGRLYNWYAVKTAGLCPSGWHIPSRNEWTVLVEYLIANGYNYDGSASEDKTAKSLATTSGWTLSVIEGTIGYEISLNNSSGFTALPGGGRGSTGAYFDAGEYGYWWTSTENTENTDEAYFRVLSSSWTDFYEDTCDKNAGFSVRCVKD